MTHLQPQNEKKDGFENISWFFIGWLDSNLFNQMGCKQIWHKPVLSDICTKTIFNRAPFLWPTTCFSFSYPHHHLQPTIQLQPTILSERSPSSLLKQWTFGIWLKGMLTDRPFYAKSCTLMVLNLTPGAVFGVLLDCSPLLSSE